MKKTKIFTAGIRGISALSRLVLFLYLGRNVDPAIIGIYGLIAATSGLVVQFVGLEFHYFNARAILAVESEGRSRLIRDQFVLHLMCYVAVIPWLSLIFACGFLDWKYAVYFFPLVIFEHLGQELFRVLVTCFRPVFATFVLFVRSGLWAFVFIVVVELAGKGEPLETLLLIWLIFSVLSVILGMGGLWSQLSTDSVKDPINWEWLWGGIRKSVPFLVTTVCFTALQYFDRFFLNYFLGERDVGIFFFFSSLASILYIVLTFSVGIFHGPKTIYAFQNLGVIEYNKERSLLAKNYMVVGGIVIVPAILAIYIVLGWVGKAVYYDHLHVYWIMLLANVVLIASDFVNFDLYVRGRDMAIMWSAVIAMFLSAALQFLFVPAFGMIGAAIATTSSYLALGAVRYLFLKGYPSTIAGK